MNSNRCNSADKCVNLSIYYFLSTYLSIHSSMYSFIRLCIYSSILPFIINSFIRSFAYLFIYLFLDPFIHSLTESPLIAQNDEFRAIFIARLHVCETPGLGQETQYLATIFTDKLTAFVAPQIVQRRTKLALYIEFKSNEIQTGRSNKDGSGSDVEWTWILFVSSVLNFFWKATPDLATLWTGGRDKNVPPSSRDNGAGRKQVEIA